METLIQAAKDAEKLGLVITKDEEGNIKLFNEGTSIRAIVYIVQSNSGYGQSWVFGRVFTKMSGEKMSKIFDKFKIDSNKKSFTSVEEENKFLRLEDIVRYTQLRSLEIQEESKHEEEIYKTLTSRY